MDESREANFPPCNRCANSYGSHVRSPFLACPDGSGFKYERPESSLSTPMCPDCREQPCECGHVNHGTDIRRRPRKQQQLPNRESLMQSATERCMKLVRAHTIEHDEDGCIMCEAFKDYCQALLLK